MEIDPGKLETPEVADAPTADPVETPRADGAPATPAAAPVEVSPSEPPLPPTTPEMGIVDMLYGMLAQPTATLAHYAAHPRPWLGIIVGLVVAIVSVIGSASAMPPVPGMRGNPLSGASLAALVPVFGVLAVIGIFMHAGIYHVLAELMGGRGSVLGLVTLFGLSSIPGVIAVPANAILGVLRLGPLSALVSFGIGIWSIVLAVKSVKANYGFSTGKAFLTLAMPVIAGFIALIGIFVIIGVSFANSPLFRNLQIPGLP